MMADGEHRQYENRETLPTAELVDEWWVGQERPTGSAAIELQELDELAFTAYMLGQRASRTEITHSWEPHVTRLNADVDKHDPLCQSAETLTPNFDFCRECAFIRQVRVDEARRIMVAASSRREGTIDQS